jgi:hypothetical protein
MGQPVLRWAGHPVWLNDLQGEGLCLFLPLPLYGFPTSLFPKRFWKVLRK